jgi:hypothetical protein
MLFYFGRYEETSEKRLLLLCTKSATMLDWGSSTFDITTAGIVGVAYCCMVLCTVLCWCWQCLLKVSGNLLPHTLTPLGVTTLAWCCRQTQDVLHSAESHTAALHSSQWQLTASVFTAWLCTGSYSSLCEEDYCLYHNLSLWFFLLDRCNWQVCHLILSITFHKFKFLPVRAAHNRVVLHECVFFNSLRKFFSAT